MQNASRRGAVDMGMPLMVLAFIVIGGFMYWLSGQAAQERASRVVEEAPQEEDSGVSGGDGDVMLGEMTAVGVDPDAFVGETIRGLGYEVASAFGTAGFWVNTPSGNPFLVAYSEELKATGVTVAQGDYVDVVGELLRMGDQLPRRVARRGRDQRQRQDHRRVRDAFRRGQRDRRRRSPRGR